MLTGESKETELRCICPFCDSLTQTGRIDAKFYINLTTGLYYCFHCQAKGKDLTDEQLASLDVIDEIAKKAFDQTLLATLRNRFESQDLYDFIGKRFPNLTDKQEALIAPTVFYSEERKAIALVIRDFNQEITGIKYRMLDPHAKQRYMAETGSSMEGHWIKGTDDTKLLILEGELDGLTAALSGFKGSILACQRNRISESQLKAIRSFRNIFILPDNDLGGSELENSSNELLGALNTTIVKLPTHIKDLNELLIKDGYEQCSQFVQKETRTQLEKDTRSLSECIPELLTWLSDDRHSRGDSTGWNSIDYLLGGGLRSGEMSVINSFAKTGKSSFINNLIHNLAKSGKQIGLASFEMPPHFVYTSLISIALQTNLRGLDPLDREELLAETTSEFAYLDNIKMLQRFGYTSWKDVEEWALSMKKLRNIDYLVLDHAGFMVEKMTDAEENQVLAKSIKKLTNTLGIHILVVVQAPKTKDGLSIQTAYGGLSWGMNADNFIILERSKENETELKVKLEAARYPGSNPSSTPALLFYQRESCTLTE